LDRLGEVQALLEEKENKVIELQGHSRDYADEICSLSQELEKEQELHMTLEESYGNLEESHNLDMSHIQKERDHALAMSKVLKNEKSGLGVGHARLLEDHEKLNKEFKALESKFLDLTKSHAQLQAQLNKELLKTPNVDALKIIMSTNPCCEHASIIEENSRLKAQIEKGLATCIQGEKNLNDLLSNQRDNLGKEGLGFGTKSKKKKNNKSKKKKALPTIPSKIVSFVKEGESAQEKEKGKVEEAG